MPAIAPPQRILGLEIFGYIEATTTTTKYFYLAATEILCFQVFFSPCLTSCFYFSSHSSDAAQSACRSNRSSSSPSSPQSINESANTTTTASKNKNTSSKPTALFVAAKEADRITNLAGKRSTSMKLVSMSREEDQSRRQQQQEVASSVDTSSTDSSSPTNTFPTTTTSIAQQALDAARSLLIVSRPSNALADAILAAQHQSSSSSLVTNLATPAPQPPPPPPPCAEIASLHRAFLAITSWCLDVLEAKQQQEQQQQQQQQQLRNEEEDQPTTTATIRTDDILDRTLTVSRRAHDLNLPFHLPLYQRLMEAVARQQQNRASHPPLHDLENSTSAATTATTVRTILEIASWVASQLNATAVTANLFVPALRILMDHRQYPAMAQLLASMQSIYGLADLEHDVALDFWNQLRDSSSRRHQADDDNDDNDEFQSSASANHSSAADVDDQAVSEIMERLEDTIVQYIGAAGDAFQIHLDDAVNAADNDMSDNDRDQDDHDEDDESGDELTDSLDRVIDKLLSLGLSESQVRRVLRVWVESTNRSDPPSSSWSKRGSLQLPGIEIFGAVQHGDCLILEGEIRPSQKSSAATKWRSRMEDNDLSSDSDSDSDDEADGDQDEIIYLRQDSLEFPDVTAQLEQLNGNRALLFTTQYEEILWMRDYDEELYGEGGEHGIMFRRSDADSDSDDDDGNDDDGVASDSSYR